MSGIKIIGVKVVGNCSKCRKEGDEIPKNKDGSIIPDKDISCVNTAFGNCTKDDIICRTPTEEFLKLEKENGVCTKDDGGKN